MNPWLCSIVLKEALRNHNKIGSKIYYCVLFFIWPPSSTGEKKQTSRTVLCYKKIQPYCHLFSTVLCLSLTPLSLCIYRTACTLSWNTSVVGISCIISSRSASLRNPTLCEYSSRLCLFIAPSSGHTTKMWHFQIHQFKIRWMANITGRWSL